jgi:pimeloyl-ACP methyl ester carboxylesterase
MNMDFNPAPKSGRAKAPYPDPGQDMADRPDAHPHKVHIMEKIVRNGNVEIATQAFGDPAASPVLLIMGVMASMLWWPDDFCRMLALSGRHVIRYDHRDTGLSTCYEPGEAPYSMEDMADDAMAVLDAHGIARASLVGMSLGGTVAQIAALRHPERVSTLTLISATPLGVDAASLPGMSEAYLAHCAESEHVDWTDRAQVIDHVVKDMRLIAGTAHAHDEAGARALVERDVARARNFASATNHFTVQAREDWRNRLSHLRVPLLVLHGTHDPIYPVEHGRWFEEAVPGSRFTAIEGGGHELHPQDWLQIVEEVAMHSTAQRIWRAGGAPDQAGNRQATHPE